MNNQTPYIIYDLNHVKSQYSLLNTNITASKLICYALKANFNQTILQTLIELGAGVDCVSIEEIKLAMANGCKSNQIVFSGVGKQEHELEFAIQNNILQISAESEEEIDDIAQIAHKLNTKANIGLRLNLDIKVNTHKYISTGEKTTKFGISANKIKSLIEKIKQIQVLNLVGLSIHIGSQILDYRNFEEAFNAFATIVSTIKNLKHISLGGGLGVAYKPEDVTRANITTQKYIETVNNFANQVKLPIILEPGRFLVANAGKTIAKVVRIKQADDTTFMILNVGMNNILRPALYQAYHHIAPLIPDNTKLNKVYTIVGPVCESSDVFHQNYTMQEIKAGDLVEIWSTGAYCSSMASNYNLMPICKEFFITNN